jgi:hypothetical protein
MQSIPETASVAVICDIEPGNHQNDENQKGETAIEPAALYLRHIAGLNAVYVVWRATQ